MTLIVDPEGSPVIVYGSAEPVMYEVSTAGVDGSDARLLTRHSSYTVLVITIAGAGQGLRFPTDSEIGDAYEIHQVSGGDSYSWYKENGDLISSASFSLFRKMPDGSWHGLA